MTDPEKHALYIAVFEHKGDVFQGLTRAFMRHTSVMEKVKDNDFNIYHVQGTPGIGLRYLPVQHCADPRKETAQLLLMHHISDVLVDRCSEMDSIAKSIPIVTSRAWNCQDWVIELLDALVIRDIISSPAKEDGIEKLKETVQLPFTSETPNTTALTD